jgi:hypothetical protein
MRKARCPQVALALATKLMDSRLYPIKNSPDYFRTGVSPSDGTQALCFYQGKYAICVKFSASGRLIGSESKSRLDLGNDEAIFDEIEGWVAELGFIPGTIRVQKFALSERCIEIRDMPDYLQEYVESPSRFPKERQAHLSECVDKWLHAGSYVLIWDEEYEMSVDGEVEST